MNDQVGNDPEPEEWMVEAPRDQVEDFEEDFSSAYNEPPNVTADMSDDEIKSLPAFLHEKKYISYNRYFTNYDDPEYALLSLFKVRYSQENIAKAKDNGTFEKLKNDPLGWKSEQISAITNVQVSSFFEELTLPGQNALPEGSRLYDVAGAVMMMQDIYSDDSLLNFLRDLAGMINFDCAEDLFCEEHIYPNRDRSRKVRLSFSDIVMALKMRKVFLKAGPFMIQNNSKIQENFQAYETAREDFVVFEQGLETIFNKIKEDEKNDGNPREDKYRTEYNQLVGKMKSIREKAFQGQQQNDPIKFKNFLEEKAYQIAYNIHRENRNFSSEQKFPEAYFLNPRLLDEPGPGRSLDFRVAVLMTTDERLDFPDFKVILKPSVTSAINSGLRLMNGAYSMARGNSFENSIQRFTTVDDNLLKNYNLRNFLLESTRVKYRLEKINNSISRTDQAVRDIWDDQKIVITTMIKFFLGH